MLPENKEQLINRPETLFGGNYQAFLEFANKVTRHKGKALRVGRRFFNREILVNLGISENLDDSYRQIIEEKAQSVLRNNLPHLVRKGHYDPTLPENKHYEEVARQTIEGILTAFKEYVNHNFPEKNKKYKDRISLLAGLAAIEVLFIPEDNHRLRPLLNCGC